MRPSRKLTNSICRVGRRPGIHNPQTVIMDSGLARRRAPRNDGGEWMHGSRARMTTGMVALARQILELRMLAQIIRHETAAGDHLAAVGADQLQRTFHQLRRDAAPA